MLDIQVQAQSKKIIGIVEGFGFANRHSEFKEERGVRV